MDPLVVLAVAGPAAAILYVLIITFRASGAPGPSTWLLPAVASLLFLGYTAATIAEEGVLQVFVSHTETLWGVQVWLDLVFAVAISLTFLIPRARSLNMNVVPWVMLCLSTASIGLFAMLARVAYLEAAAMPAARPAAHPA